MEGCAFWSFFRDWPGFGILVFKDRGELVDPGALLPLVFHPASPACATESATATSAPIRMILVSCHPLLTLAFVLLLIRCFTYGYDLVHDYSGSTFYNEWDFYGGWDNLTLGDVLWLNRDDSYGQGLAYINTAGNAVFKVDNQNVVPIDQKRSSVRITSKAAYAIGSLWITDIVHMPFGCAVWPAFWTKGPTWPDDGEIDILEGINLMTTNKMALHTLPGCLHTTPPNQMGITDQIDCSQPAGCVVNETAPNSFGAGFNAAGGGVFAAQFDVGGIFIWFWSRPNIPSAILTATSDSPMDVSQWGPPSASYPAVTCDITKLFSPQNLVFDITLCGNWAGLPENYQASCGNQGPTGFCYQDSVVGSGDRFNEAYFEVKYVRAYTTGGIAPTPTAPAVAYVDTVPQTTSAAQAPVGTALKSRPLFNGAISCRSSRHGFLFTLISMIIFLLTS